MAINASQFSDPRIQQALGPGSQFLSQFPDDASALKYLQGMQGDYDARQGGTYQGGSAYDQFGRPNLYGLHYTQGNANSDQLAPDFDPGPLFFGLGTAGLGAAGALSALGSGGSFGHSLLSALPGIDRAVKGVNMAITGGGGGGGTGGLDPQSAMLLQALLGGGNNALSNLSGVTGAAGAGLAAQRGLQGSLAGQRAGAAQSQYQDALQAALLKQLQAPQMGADMARRGDLMANVQDMKAVFTPGQGYSFTGGLRPSALGPNARAAGAALSNQGLNVAQGGLNLPATPDLTSGFPSSGPGGLEQGLQMGALGSGILGALKGNSGILQKLLSGAMSGGDAASGGLTAIGTNPSDIMSQLPGFDPSQYVDPEDWMNLGIG